MNWTPFPPERPGKYLHTTKPDDIEALEYGDVYEQDDRLMFKDELDSLLPYAVLDLSGWWLEIVTPQSTPSKELSALVETLPPMKTSELIRLTGGKYSKDTCRWALVRSGKLLLTEAERHKDIVSEIKASPTPLTSTYIRKKYGVASNTATNLLRSCGKFSRVRLDSCYSIAKSLTEPMLARDFAQKYNKSLKQSRKALTKYGKLKRVEARQRRLKLTAKQIAETLTEPISAKEFSEKYNKTLKITYKALKETGKLKPVPTGRHPSNGADKPPANTTPSLKRSTSEPKPRQQKSSFDKFYSNFSKYAKRIQDDEFAYID